jgi:hypothetical protein
MNLINTTKRNISASIPVFVFSHEGKRVCRYEQKARLPVAQMGICVRIF